MSCFDDLIVGGQFRVGTGIVPSIKEGDKKINGSAFIEGPAVIGNPTQFPFTYATLMVGPLTNSDPDSTSPFAPGALCTGVNNPYSLCVTGHAAIFDNLDANGQISAGRDIIAQGEIMSRCGGHILSAKKNFDIPHPTKEGWRLRHTCPEGPSNDVYYRGKLKNKSEIELPKYWKELVDEDSITVNITPLGSHQSIIVKRISDNVVYLQSNGGVPINCYYHIFATRKDGEQLIPEYIGNSPEDYPGNNDEYSVSGYHYDVK